MAITQGYIVSPGTALGANQLMENLIIIRDAQRELGHQVSLLRLISGGTPGTFAQGREFEDAKTWASTIDEPVPESMIEMGKNLKPSGGIGQSWITWAELPGLETDYDSLPRGVVQNAVIKIHQGKQTAAFDQVAKSKGIMNQ